MGTITERHIYTQELISMLRKVGPGDTISYSDMTAKIGMDVRPNHPGYGYQKSARDILEREESIALEVVKNIGLRRLMIDEVALGTGSKYIRSKKSLIKRTKRRIQTIDDEYDNLSPEGKLRVTSARTILAFDAELSKPKAILKIEDKVKNDQALIGFDETIQLFGA